MEYPEAIQRLLNHANLPSTGVPAADGLLQALAQEPQPGPAVAQQLADVVACYEAINRHLNGPVPSQRSWADKVAIPLDRTLAYAVSTLLCGLWQHLSECQDAEPANHAACAHLSAVGHAVELGWNFVLASDFDSITEEIGYYYSPE
ncbi:hypothetical protein [Hymenobacter sp. IS2118]|uniref:hypothetical protein n=1 Tax=Hymenobacter sp. IS2118 TaxID=1505605 RepID=UPI00054D5911|nr:hypothetical protein [Hymenobacter sp. IS2118]